MYKSRIISTNKTFEMRQARDGLAVSITDWYRNAYIKLSGFWSKRN